MAEESKSAVRGAAGKRTFLGVRFGCCNVYTRIYKTRRGDAYAGACPRCGRSVRIGIDERDGSDARLFEVLVAPK